MSESVTEDNGAMKSVNAPSKVGHSIGESKLNRFLRIVSAIVLAICAMALPEALYAQFGQANGAIIGKVVDEQGGVLPVYRSS